MAGDYECTRHRLVYEGKYMDLECKDIIFETVDRWSTSRSVRETLQEMSGN